MRSEGRGLAIGMGVREEGNCWLPAFHCVSKHVSQCQAHVFGFKVHVIGLPHCNNLCSSVCYTITATNHQY